MKKLLLASAAVLGLAATPGIAHATITYTILNGINAVTNPATLQANPTGFAAASAAGVATTTISATSTVDTLNFNSGATNTLGNFFATAALTPPLSATQAALVMSNATNTNTTFIRALETYNDQAGTTFTLTHDDGATIFVDGTMICGTPGPTNAVSQSCTLPAGTGTHSLALYYEELFGAPAVLAAALPTETTVPEPASHGASRLARWWASALFRRRRSS